ncbi:MAG: DNA methyltransferase [Anaerolineaceae bacterium]|nr:DNA methyltransferase [Anaerolineaceae bacterium]
MCVKYIIAKSFQRMHDLLYFYAAKKGGTVFNMLTESYSEKSKHKGRRFSKFSDSGKLEQAYTGDSSRQKAMRDVWEISYLNSQAKERLGYPTQKPLALLERIIRASSNEGDLVLDPFCGCGTAVEAAQNLGRRWLGIDVEPLAVDLMARRLRERCGIDPTIRGIPYDFAQAQRLAERAPYEFERWAIRLIPGAQPNFKQSGDGGLDGRAVVNVERRPQPLFGFQVKGGKQVGRPALDAFHGALTMNGCAAGLLVVLEERTAHRLRGQLGAQERVQLNGWLGPRIGVWSVEDWLEGRRGAPVPPLVGAGETLDLLQPQNWQRRLNAGVQ